MFSMSTRSSSEDSASPIQEVVPLGVDALGFVGGEGVGVAHTFTDVVGRQGDLCCVFGGVEMHGDPVTGQGGEVPSMPLRTTMRVPSGWRRWLSLSPNRTWSPADRRISRAWSSLM
jgi:hypothetical protein